MVRLLFVLLVFLLLATLSLASIPSPAKDSSLSRRKQVKKNDDASGAAGQSSQATKKPVRNRKKALKKRSKKRVGATKGVTSAGAGEKSSAVSGSGKDSQKDNVVLDFFPKVLVELIGEYLEGFSVVFERDWSAVQCWSKVAVDSERHYLITEQDVQASSHSGGVQVSLGSPDLSDYSGFHSSHDGRSVFFTGQTKEQVSSDSSEITARWLVQETSTKSLKSVALESGGSSAGYSFKLSTNGKTLLSTFYNSTSGTAATSVYQIEEHGKATSASKKANFDGAACAVSGNGNHVLLKCKWKRQLEIHDISRGESQLVLKIDYAEKVYAWSCALNSNGSKAAFIGTKGKLYIVDVDKQKGFISVSQLTPIDIPSSFISSELVYDAKDRLYAFKGGNLWLADDLKRELVSLEEADVPQGYMILSSAISPNADYIALLIRSTDKSEKGEYQFQMVFKRKDPKDPFMRLCGYES